MHAYQLLVPKFDSSSLPPICDEEESEVNGQGDETRVEQ